MSTYSEIDFYIIMHNFFTTITITTTTSANTAVTLCTLTQGRPEGGQGGRWEDKRVSNIRARGQSGSSGFKICEGREHQVHPSPDLLSIRTIFTY